MQRRYHHEITRNALQNIFSNRALRLIISANLAQDGLIGLIYHPEFHFDNNTFVEGREYIRTQRKIICDTLYSIETQSKLVHSEVTIAWYAFGRLCHAAQDFYAHSNYVSLWLERFSNTEITNPEAINPVDQSVLYNSRLLSGHIYYPWEVLCYLPLVGRIIRDWLPKDSHAWMNLDSPKQGLLFQFAYTAAMKRTKYEYGVIEKMVSPSAIKSFTG
jgi:hypothetical protein